jgi:hypothetical protein
MKLAHPPEMNRQRLPHPRRQHRDPILVPFPPPHPDLAALRIEVLDPERERLGESHPPPYNTMATSQTSPVNCERIAATSRFVSTAGIRRGPLARTRPRIFPSSLPKRRDTKKTRARNACICVL